jgi:cytochrome c1
MALLAAPVLAGCTSTGTQPSAVIPGASLESGKVSITHYGCGSCHTIPGVRGADALVGPPLTKFGRRSFIAGQLSNTPDNLVRWITDPKGVEPGTDMPNLGVTGEEARNIAAYLESLR